MGGEDYLILLYLFIGFCLGAAFVVFWIVALSGHNDRKIDDVPGVLTPAERADLLNLLTDTLDKHSYNLTIAGYDDTSGVIFEVLLEKRFDEEGVKIEGSDAE